MIGIRWRAAPHERLHDPSEDVGKPGGYYVVDAEGTERGPFAECPPSPDAAAQAAEVQLLLAQEPRP